MSPGREAEYRFVMWLFESLSWACSAAGVLISLFAVFGKDLVLAAALVPVGVGILGLPYLRDYVLRGMQAEDARRDAAAREPGDSQQRRQ